MMVSALGIVAIALPGCMSPADEAAAYCWSIEGVDDCFNHCDPIILVLDVARELGQDPGPNPPCPD